MKKLSGVLYVFLGAVSYGILATIVKYANGLGIHISVLTFFQFFIGFLVLLVLNTCNNQQKSISTSSKVRLLAWGSSLGLTSTLYYLAIQYIPVSIGIILLMQSIWMSLILEIILTKKRPSLIKSIAALLCIAGTIFSTQLFSNHIPLNWMGITLGFCAGLSYTFSIYSVSTIEKSHTNYVRSLYFVLGGLLFISLFWNYSILTNLSMESLAWGSLLALFGTVFPPLLFTAGIPKTGIAIGNIITSVEIPVSIFSAYLILEERITFIQWIGVCIILFAVVIVNWKQMRGTKGAH